MSWNLEVHLWSHLSATPCSLWHLGPQIPLDLATPKCNSASSGSEMTALCLDPSSCSTAMNYPERESLGEHKNLLICLPTPKTSALLELTCNAFKELLLYIMFRLYSCLWGESKFHSCCQYWKSMGILESLHGSSFFSKFPKWKVKKLENGTWRIWVTELVFYLPQTVSLVCNLHKLSLRFSLEDSAST